MKGRDGYRRVLRALRLAEQDPDRCNRCGGPMLSKGGLLCTFCRYTREGRAQRDVEDTRSS